MKKISLILSFVFCCTLFSFAQSVQEQQVTFEKTQVPGYVVRTNYSADIVNGAVTQKWEKGFGLKASKVSGYKAFLAQKLQTISDQNLDVYVMAKETGKKNAKVTEVTVLVSTGNNNFVSSYNNPDMSAKIKAAVADLIAFTAVYAVEQAVTLNNNNINKLNSEVQKLESEKQKLQKQLNDVDKKINDKKVEIEKLQNDNTKLQQK